MGCAQHALDVPPYLSLLTCRIGWAVAMLRYSRQDAKRGLGTSEALALGMANGLDPKVLSEIMRRSSGGN